jgi:tRNA(Ile)-lysidine synthase
MTAKRVPPGRRGSAAAGDAAIAGAPERQGPRIGGPGTTGLVSAVAARLAGVVRSGESLVVGLSGGIDSVVLLDVLQRLRSRLRFQLSALHVNHQLSRAAARWSGFCRRLCRRRGIPLRSVRVTVARGASLEGRARAARYAVFARQRCDYIVLAQHQDDQVETLFLQLLRGAGVKGLAGMPLLREAKGERRKAEGSRPAPGGTEGGRRRADGWSSRSSASSFRILPSILRPLLDVTRAEIESYARGRGLAWVEDESNAEVLFQRNFLRHEVLPVIATRFPGYRATVARSARHLGESAALLDELAASDGAGAFDGTTLAVTALRRLSRPRGRNLLRYFLAARGASMPNAGRLDEALRQAMAAGRDAQVAIDLGGEVLRRFDDRLYVVTAHRAQRSGRARRWKGEGKLVLPEFGGSLLMKPARGVGLSLARLHEHPVWIRARQGGESLRPDPRRPRRTLKNLMQEALIPPWERERLPLLFCGRDLVWAPAVGPDCRYRASPGESGVVPLWRPAEGGGTS